ncbi:MAG: hypothetical protein AAGD32_04360 [Planctomycetota bacterium]
MPDAALDLPSWAIWGNRNGWIIATFLLLALVALLALTYVGGGNTGRTALSLEPANLERLQLPARDEQLDRMVPATTPGDGGALLAGATAQVVERPGLLEDFLGQGGRADPASVEPILATVRDATGRESLTLFRDPAAVLVYPRNDTRQELRAIKNLGKALLHAGLLRETRGDLEAATADYEAAFLLGRRLFQQRLVEEQLHYGVMLMREASEGLASVRESAGGDSTVPRAVAKALQTWQAERLEPMRQVFLVEDAAVTGVHVGDYIALAEASEEPVWRIESVLTLGRHRFNAARRPDQVAAEAEVFRLAQEASDPHVRAAAQQARDLDLPGHRMVRFGRY